MDNRYFITFQPKAVADTLRNGLDYIPSNTTYAKIAGEFGYNPIFIISLESRKELLYWLIICTPSVAEYMIVFQTENYDRIDAAKWYETKGNEKEHKSLKPDNEQTICEYITSAITVKSVTEIVEIGSLISLSKAKAIVTQLKKEGFPAIEEKIILSTLMECKEFWKKLDGKFVQNDQIPPLFRFSIMNKMTEISERLYSNGMSQGEMLAETWELFK